MGSVEQAGVRVMERGAGWAPAQVTGLELLNRRAGGWDKMCQDTGVASRGQKPHGGLTGWIRLAASAPQRGDGILMSCDLGLLPLLLTLFFINYLVSTLFLHRYQKMETFQAKYVHREVCSLLAESSEGKAARRRPASPLASVPLLGFFCRHVASRTI